MWFLSKHDQNHLGNSAYIQRWRTCVETHLLGDIIGQGAVSEEEEFSRKTGVLVITYCRAGSLAGAQM